MPCRATQDGRIMVESSDKTRSTGKGNGKPLQMSRNSCLENPMNSMKRQKDKTLKDELPRSVGAQYATGDHWSNNSKNNEGMEPKQKQHLVVNGTGDGKRDSLYIWPVPSQPLVKPVRQLPCHGGRYGNLG